MRPSCKAQDIVAIPSSPSRDGDAPTPQPLPGRRNDAAQHAGRSCLHGEPCARKLCVKQLPTKSPQAQIAFVAHLRQLPPRFRPVAPASGCGGAASSCAGRPPAVLSPRARGHLAMWRVDPPATWNTRCICSLPSPIGGLMRRRIGELHGSPPAAAIRTRPVNGDASQVSCFPGVEISHLPLPAVGPPRRTLRPDCCSWRIQPWRHEVRSGSEPVSRRDAAPAGAGLRGQLTTSQSALSSASERLQRTLLVVGTPRGEAARNLSPLPDPETRKEEPRPWR